MLPGGGMFETLISILEYLVPQSFLGLQSHTIIYFFVFVIFVYLAYRFLKLAFKGLLIFVAAAFFPVVANYFLGLGIPITFNSIISYASAGLFFYIIGMLLKSVANIIKIVTWPLRKLFGESEEEKLEELEKRVDEEGEKKREEEEEEF